MVFDPVDSLDSADAVLDAVAAWHTEVRDRERWTFLAAARFADLHSPDSRPAGRVLPGMERCVRLGGEGTPLVREFVAAEFAARIGKSTWTGQKLTANALDVRERFPRLWAGANAGTVRVYLACLVAERTRHLSLEAAGWVDGEVAEYADGRISFARFEAILAGKITAADPDAAAAKEQQAREAQFARATRASEHGMKGFYLRSTIGVVARFDATVAYLAEALKALGDTDSVDLRRTKACLILANPVQAVELLQAFAAHRARTTDSGDQPEPEDDPGAEACPSCGGMSGNPEPFTKPRPFRPGDLYPGVTGRRWRFDPARLLPPITLFLHLSQDTIARDSGGVARWEGEGPISSQYVRDHLAPYHRFTIKPVIDLANQAPVDAYEIPHRHRQAVHLRTPADIFPFSTNLSRSQQIDHTRPYRNTGHRDRPACTTTVR